MTPPRIIAWAMPLLPPFRTASHHGVISFDTGGSVLTICAGRWPKDSPMCIHPGGSARVLPICGRCAHLASIQNEPDWRAELARSMTYTPIGARHGQG